MDMLMEFCWECKLQFKYHYHVTAGYFRNEGILKKNLHLEEYELHQQKHRWSFWQINKKLNMIIHQRLSCAYDNM